MPKTNKSAKVPKGADDPIEHLLAAGAKVIDLAQAWGLRSTDAIYRLRRYEYPPKARTAERMAESFGWTAGQVLDHWLSRVKR
jgi:hypothetical protein